VPSIEYHFNVQEGFSEKTGGRVSWQVPPDLPYFEGHFPGRPILPGVAILMITEELMGQVFRSSTFRLKEVRSAKFLAPISPGQTVSIEFVRKKESEMEADWRVGDSEKPVIRLRLRLSA